MSCSNMARLPVTTRVQYTVLVVNSSSIKLPQQHTHNFHKTCFLCIGVTFAIINNKNNTVIQPIAAETQGPIKESAVDFLRELGHSFRRSDSLPICFRGCLSLCSNTMQSFCMTALHQTRTSGHRWDSFYLFFI